MKDNRGPATALFGMDQESMANHIRDLAAVVSGNVVQLAAYCLRRGGASWDYLMKYRAIQD
eukprot:10398051-Lingulodinium_polyedra.AAC.1